MKTALLAAAAVSFPAASFALTMVSDNKLPFRYTVVSVEDVQALDGVRTRAVLTFENGKHFLSSVSFHCEAENAEGRTWDVTGRIANVDPNAQRTTRLSSEPDTTGDYRDPVSVSCAVQAFDIPLM